MNTPTSPARVNFRLIVKGFAPGWPAAVMCTGAFALATLHFSHQLPALAGLAWALHGCNLLLFALISIPWLLRWVMARRAVVATFKHPVADNFYPSYAIALLVLAAELRVFGWLAWALLAGIWTLTLVKTIGGIVSGKLFQPHP